MLVQNRFSFQRLEVYRIAKEALAISVAERGRFRGLPGEVAPQMERALVSVVLNIAEGAGRWTAPDQRRHYQIACGSATEAAACLEIAELHGVEKRVTEAMLERLGHVVPMLLALVRRR